jgi:PleD family two-component response regulator
VDASRRLDELLQTADSALYAAKRSGRDRALAYQALASGV